MLRRIVSFIISILLLVPVLGAQILTIDATSSAKITESMDKQCQQLFVHQEKNNVVTHSLSGKNYSELKDIMKSKNVADSEINRFVYRQLGYNDEQIDAIGQHEIDLIMSTTLEITVQEMYIKINADGSQQIVGKEEGLQNLAALQNKQNPKTVENDRGLLSDNNSENEEDVSGRDGYIRILTRSDYIDPSSVSGEKGWYYFSGTFEWLSIPTHRGLDAFSIYAPGCAWGQSASDTFSSLFVSYIDYNNNWQTDAYTKQTEDRYVTSNGLWYEWRLLNDEYVEPMLINNRYQYFKFYIRGKARLTNYTTQQAFNVFTRYEHCRSVLWITPTFGWTTGGQPGVTVTGSWENSYDTYCSYNYTHYDPNL